METPNKDLTPTKEDPKEEENVTLTKAEVEEMKAYEKRYKDSQKEWELVAHRRKTREDNSYLVQLASTNRKMAENVAKEFWLTLDEALAQIKWETGDKPDKWVTKEELKQQMQEIRDQEEWEKVLSKFIADKHISGEFLEDFQQEFDDYMEGKKMTPQRVEKATRYALSEAKKVSKFAEEYAKIESKKSDLGGRGGSPEKPKSSVLQAMRQQDEKKDALWKKHNLLNRDKD